MDIYKHILKISKELMMQYGIRSVSMDDIASKCGISKKTIYQHFENKSSMVRELICAYLDEDQEMLCEIESTSENAIDEIVTIAKNVIAFMKEMRPVLIYDLQKYYPELWHIVEQNHLTYVESNIRSNIIRGKKEGLYLENVNEDILAKIYVHNSLLISDKQVFPEKDFDRAELFKTIILNHIRGIISEKGRKILNNATIK